MFCQVEMEEYFFLMRALLFVHRSATCAPKTPLAPNYPHEHVCGRPLGIRFNKATGELWIVDAYLGIFKVGAEGGQAESVVNAIDGVRMKFVNDLDFDEEGNLYFTDSSTHWQRRQFIHCLMEADDTGRLIKYNPTTKETTVLLNNLRFPNGVAVSKDGTFIVMAEGRLGRYSTLSHHQTLILPIKFPRLSS